MSASLASNVPGYEGPYNFISDGCPQRLVDDMMSCLWGMSDNAYCLTRGGPWTHIALNSMTSAFAMARRRSVHGTLRMARLKLAACLVRAQERMSLTKAQRALEQWMRCIPVVSFNGGHYDLQLIKPYLAAIYGTYAPPWLHCSGLMRALNSWWPLTVCQAATGVGMR